MTETNRNCARCKQTLPKKEYSKNQWSKGTNKSKCKGCVSDKLIPKELFKEKSSAKNKLKRFMKRKVGKKKKKQEVIAVNSDTEDEENCSAVACIPLPAVIWSRSMTYLPASDFLNTLIAMSSNASMLKEVLPTIIVQTRAILSKNLPPIQQTANISGLSKMLFDLMACEDSSPKLRFDTASILSVIASEKSKSVMDAGAIPVFASLLSKSDQDLCSAAVFALGNIAADHRTEVISSGVIQPLLELLKPGKDLSIQRNATWLLSNLCRGAHDQDFCLQSFDTLSLLLSNPDEEILVESCWALVSLTNEHIESVVEANFCPRLCQLLNHSSQEVVIPALRAVGNIATGSSAHVQVLLDNNVLPALLYFLSHERKLIQTEACWVISSFTSSTMNHIQSVVDNANILPKLSQLMSRRAGDLTLCMEATYAMVNVARKGNVSQVNELMRLGFVRPLVQSLDKDLKAKHTFIILNGLHYLLHKSRQNATTQIRQYDGFNKIKKIKEKKAKSSSIQKLCGAILCQTKG